MPANNNPTKSAGAGGPPVRVRMYRTGLGDCFLITFDPGGNEVHMLIDCGSLGAKTTGVKLKDAVEDISKTTNAHLHLVITTHEHKDHVCGFRDVNAEFKKFKVDNVWMAWTEDPDDDLAQQIEKYKDDLGESLTAAAAALTLKTTGDTESAAMGLAIQSLLSFVGDPEAVGASGGSKTNGEKKPGLAKTIDEAMTFVRTGMGVKARYLTPGGAAIEEPWLPGFRFYVLGPPRSLNKLGDLGDHGSGEIYGISTGLRAGAAFRAADSTVNPASLEDEMPFDSRFRCAEADPLIHPQLDSYFKRKNNWRRVDHDWLHAAADFALQLDSMTNNTSLVLAIERISDGKVLLFPADAQQGNWLSWHDPEMKLTFSANGKTQDKTAEQLLNATVFYKVGHHSSHNATAKGKGLEMMRREDELVAFIPVDRAVALGKSPKGSWRMPAPELYPHLLDKCQGRVVRSDLGWADDAANAANKEVEKELIGIGNPQDWSRWKLAQKKANVSIDVNGKFIDYTLP